MRGGKGCGPGKHGFVIAAAAFRRPAVARAPRRGMAGRSGKPAAGAGAPAVGGSEEPDQEAGSVPASIAACISASSSMVSALVSMVVKVSSVTSG